MSYTDEVADVLRRVSEVALVEARSADEFGARVVLGDYDR